MCFAVGSQHRWCWAKTRLGFRIKKVKAHFIYDWGFKAKAAAKEASADDLSEFLKEAVIMGQWEHEHIIGLHGYARLSDYMHGYARLSDIITTCHMYSYIITTCHHRRWSRKRTMPYIPRRCP